jgi:hypothetical protein
MLSSRNHLSPLRLWVGLVAAALVLCFAIGLLRSERSVVGKEAEPAAKPNPPLKLAPAKNPVQLTVLVEPGSLLGWISGIADRTGATVSIRRPGEKAEQVKIEEGNVFRWTYEVAKEQSADVVVGDLRQTVKLLPANKPEPTVFFILDRLVFRPGQTLHVVGFLRVPDAKGEFVPEAGKSVEVQLISEKKKTTAKKWQLTADAFGKFSAEYTFAESDPLETYSLSISGHKGSARIVLAEYRKLSNQLVLGGELDGGLLKLHFEAVDFQGRSVPAKSIQLTTQIVSRPHREVPGDLDASEFVYATPPVANQPSPDSLSADEQLLARFNSGPISFPTSTEAVLWTSKKESALDQSGKGELALEIPEKWRQGRYVALVQAVLIDNAGREMRANRVITLDGTAGALQLSLAKSTYSVDEAIKVKATTKDADGLKGMASLVALRLTPAPLPVIQPMGFTGVPSYPTTFNGNNISGNPGGFTFAGASGFGHGFGSGPYPGFGFSPGGFSFAPPCGMSCVGFCSGTIPSHPFPRPGATPVAPPPMSELTPGQAIERKFVTATVFQGDTATLKLPEPGAYKLVVIWNLAEGRKLQQETGVVVRQRDQLPGLSLQLEKESLEPGDPLAGTIVSRFADARVLLLLRDSAGFHWAKTIRLKDGRAAFREELPKDLRYGACVEAIYADRPSQEEPPHYASQLIHVVPRERIITIKTKHKERYEPGATVTLDVEVDRREPVDLVVSVFDRSLLDVPSGRPADIRNFYLADDRVRDTEARDLVRRTLDNVPIRQLVRRASALKSALPKNSADAVAVEALLKNFDSKRLTLDDVAVLLRLAGLHARRVNVPSATGIPEIRLTKPDVTLLEVLDGTQGGWRIHISRYYDTFLLAETHPTQRPNPYPAPPAWPNFSPTHPGGFLGMMGIGGFNGMMGMAGFGGMGGLNSSFSGGMAGFPGGMMGLPVQPPMGPAQPANAPAVAKVPGGLDTGEIWIRRDFADLAYWNGSVRTDANGKARVEFKLPDSLTVWQVHIAAISKQMHVGSANTSLQSSRAIMVSPVLPRLFAEGDEVKVSAIVVNRSGKKQTLDVSLEAKNGDVLSPKKQEVEIADNLQTLVTWKFKAGVAGEAQLLMSATCPDGKDASFKRVPVVCAGVEQILTWSGYAKGRASLTLPEGVKPSEAKLELTFAPTLAADLVDTLNFLVEYPYGCVEQTMSRFLPAVKVAQILKRKKIDNLELMKKLPGCVEAGIKRLIELQQRDGGWAWQGSGQSHEMMTPYALYGLIEAERAGYSISSEKAIPMGLARLRKYIENMGEAQSADRIYCMAVYSLRHDLDDEWWRFIERQAEDKTLSDYSLAMSLEMAVRLVRTKLADRLAAQLRERAAIDDGKASWRTAGFSRWGDDPFEITAMAMRALVAYDKDDPLIPKVVAFFTATKRGDRWNSTKDTAMIVYAMCDYLERLREDSPDAGMVTVRINDSEPIAVAIDGKNESRKLAVPAKLLRPGKNVIHFEKSPAGMMVRATLRFTHSGKNVAALDHGLQVTRQLWLLDDQGKAVREVKSGDTVPQGAYLLSAVQVVSAAPQDVRFLLVESSLPAGAEVMPLDDKRFQVESTPFVLREEREGKVAFHHEQSPRVATDRCIFHVEMAGDLIIPPSRAELMYQTDKFGHSGAFALRVE